MDGDFKAKLCVDNRLYKKNILLSAVNQVSVTTNELRNISTLAKFPLVLPLGIFINTIEIIDVFSCFARIYVIASPRKLYVGKWLVLFQWPTSNNMKRTVK